jgi:hypothetical protein
MPKHKQHEGPQIFRRAWFVPSAPAHTQDVLANNQAVVGEFIRDLEFVPVEGNVLRSADQIPYCARGVALSEAYEKLLTRFRMSDPQDSELFNGLLLQLKTFLVQQPTLLCSIFLMGGGKRRSRWLNRRGKFVDFFEEADYDGGDFVYLGDSVGLDEDRISIQIHNLQVVDRDGFMRAKDVPALAVWKPKNV